MLIIRPVKDSDRDTLRLATLYNLNWKEERFTFQDLDANPLFSHYYQSWNHTDFGLVVERHSSVFGIIWLKYFTQNDAGYGFIAEDIPELSISVFPNSRKLGIGTKLMQMAIKEAQKRSVPAISLSVELENKPAVELYLKFGFVPATDTEGTMLLKF